MRRPRLLSVILGLTLGVSAGLIAQGSLSEQVLRLLTRDNSWSGTNTYENTVGLLLESGSVPPSPSTANRLYNLGGNLYFNGVLVATSAGAGTVTSVGLALPSILTVTVSPIVAAGTLTAVLANESANTVFAGPTTGAATTPTFRAIVDADVPDTITIAGTNNVTWTSVNKSGSSLADLATRSASDLSTGTLPDARFPATLPALSGANLTALNATQLTSGTVPDARFPATLPALSGANLTALNATNLASGTVPAARMPALTGDVTSTIGTVATTLASTAVTPGTYGDSSHTVTITVDAKGRLTAASQSSLSAGTINLATSVSGVLPIANGGTHSSSVPANGQLLIGNGTDFTLATITGTADQVTVSNGAGSITLATPQSINTTSTPQFARLGLGTGAGATAVITTAGQFDLGLFDDGSCGAGDTVNWNAGQKHKSLLSAATCVYTFQNPIAGQTYDLLVVQDGTGGRLVTWPGTVTWQGGSAPTLSTGINDFDLCHFYWTGAAYLGWCEIGS